jgi:hypothetical protein
MRLARERVVVAAELRGEDVSEEDIQRRAARLLDIRDAVLERRITQEYTDCKARERIASARTREKRRRKRNVR